MITITVKLFATLRDGRFDIKEEEYESGTTIQDIVKRYAIPREQAAILFVNNKHASFEYTLQHGTPWQYFHPSAAADCR